MKRPTPRLFKPFVALIALLLMSHVAAAAGTLRAASSADQPLRIVDHHVEVLINNGFARTEVTQLFHNPNDHTVEGIYELPLPESAALAQMTVRSEDRTLYGEVVPRVEAEQIYQEQLAAGESGALATKETYQRFEFRIASIPANSDVSMTFVYYQTLDIDEGVGRYLYPLEEGGTDPGAAFWDLNDAVDGTFSAHISMLSAWPVEEIRMPELGDVADVEQPGEGRWEVDVRAQGDLSSDLVFYYRLAGDRAGRVEVIPYRAPASEEPGTFMMLLTPGADLATLDGGADYVFVLDVSGSMGGKLQTLKDAVGDALSSLGQGDRFRIVKFSGSAAELTSGWQPADGQSVEKYAGMVNGLGVEGGTNLFAGVDAALRDLDADRATGVFLVTDAVANIGTIDGPSFETLLQSVDVRVFGFLLGNSGNWPLMKLITDTTGGFYQPVSNADDIGGQMMLARNKITHAALHDFEVHIEGGDVFDLTEVPGTVHHGEQVVVFGRYRQAGRATVRVDTRITGQPRSYSAELDLPAADEGYPELERLWALAMVERHEYLGAMLKSDAGEVAAAIQDLGLRYQIVTDETSMILLDDEAFERYGIDRNNRERTLTEEEAREVREQSAPVDRSVPLDPQAGGGSDSSSGYSSGSSRGSSYGDDDGYGGGAISGREASQLSLGLLVAMLLTWRRRKS